VEDLASGTSSADNELKTATSLRKKEAAAFASVETDLMETVDAVKRAGMIIDREMRKGASLAQLSGARGLVAALDALVQASEVRSADASRLSALLQSAAKNEDEDGDAADTTVAPEASSYGSQSEGIADLLEDLRGKAEDQLEEARKAEAEQQHNYELVKQALVDEMKVTSKDMSAAKKSSAAAAEKKERQRAS